MIVHRCEQRTSEWYQLRCGRLTGSVAGDMLANIKSGEAAARRDLRMQLIVERLTGRPQDDGNGFVNDVMRRGIELEPAAMAFYEALTGNVAERTGFIAHDSLLAGCSLDGHMGDFEGLLSIKCPKSATHLGYIRGGILPNAYRPQALHELWITGAHYYDFLSFDDRFPEALQTFYVRVQRADLIDQLADYEKKARAFLDEVERELEAVRTMANVAGQLTEALAR